MKFRETNKSRKAKKRTFRGLMVSLLVTLLLFQVWFPFHGEELRHDGESGKCQVSCQTTDQTLFLVRPLPLLIGQAGILRSAQHSFFGNHFFSMISLKGNFSHFSSVSEMRLIFLTHHFHTQINRPLRN